MLRIKAKSVKSDAELLVELNQEMEDWHRLADLSWQRWAEKHLADELPYDSLVARSKGKIANTRTTTKKPSTN